MSLGKFSPDSSTMEMKREPEPGPMSVSELWTWPYSPGPTLWGTRGWRRGGTRLCWSTSGADTALPLGNWLPALRQGQLNSVHTCVGLPCLRSQPCVCPPCIHRDLCAEKPPWQIPSQKLLAEKKTQSQGLWAQGFCLTSPSSEPQWE